ncbi:MAG TPA: FtsK/SpoIIIE domain-containing protein [Jatrophihabitans sp.]|uniref:FtsK/SpoIIIE domain-containing protein n=1 Tax=Jatrophihabitans sp. TaxID=1932789 RepID=UPI002DFF8FDD|nr:FtsK/SpoIIIE domain-containing protein [Jatrophihabitans sp.]
MRIELTITGPSGRHDIAIVGDPLPTVGAVRAELAARAGAGPDDAVWSGSRELRPHERIGGPALRTGAVLGFGTPEPSTRSDAGPELQVVGGPAAGLTLPLTRGRLTIGRADTCDLTLADDRVSREHARLEVTATTVVLHDLGSVNGTTLDGAPIGSGGQRLRPGSMVRLGDTLLAVREVDVLPAALVPGDAALLVNRAPRHLGPLPTPEIPRPDSGDAPAAGRVPWLAALLPAALGAAIAGVTGSRLFLLFALLSPVLLLSTALGDRLHWRRSRRRAGAALRLARAEADRAVSRALAVESGERRRRAPDPAVLHGIATAPGSRLWERRRGDADHLGLRLGPAELDSAVRVRTGTEVAPAGRLSAVPFVVDLRLGPLGVSGPEDVTAGLVRWLVVQLAVLQSPADIQLVLLLSRDTAPAWTWARWLPHLRDVGTSSAEWQRVVTDLGEELALRSTRSGERAAWSGVWVVLVLDRAGAVADVGGLSALLAQGVPLGVAAICVDRDAAALPTVTRIAVRVDDPAGTRATIGGRAAGAVVLDRVSVGYARQIARALAPLVDAADDAAALPATVGLTHALGLDDVAAEPIARRWARSGGGADTVLGATGDGPLRLDLAVDGPHALVAGTTGSGKSELLRSWVAGLAASHPPDSLTLLLVDYKGGAAFADCARLPHCVGVVTDLDPALTRRALISFEAELRRREHLFADAGVDDLAAYRAAGGRGIARLLIVVDEFATLAEELPEFVRGLVGVAQRGRSLGLHLVLATQRPGAAVTPDIRANTSLRIALRVTDPADSTDVIDVPDAAQIDRGHPGRAYLRSGGRLVPFQTASTATAGAAGTGVEVLGPWRRRISAGPVDAAGGGLARLVDAVAAAGRDSARPAPPALWLAPLPVSLARSGLPASGPATSVPLGRLDQPAELAQPVLEVDLTAGRSILLVGGPGSGRTGALASLGIGAAAGLPPDVLQLYVVDTGALSPWLGDLPHLASTVSSADPGAVGTLLHRLRNAVEPARRRPALLLLLIDDWDAVLDAGDDADRSAWTEALAALLRSGPRAGLTVATAGGRSLLAARTSAAYDARWLLPLVDPADYPLGGVPARAVPTALPPGRGIRAADGAHFQLADPADLDALARVAADRWASAPLPEPLVRVRPLPGSVRRAELPVDDRLAPGWSSSGRPDRAAPPCCGCSQTRRPGSAGRSSSRPRPAHPWIGSPRAASCDRTIRPSGCRPQRPACCSSTTARCSSTGPPARSCASGSACRRPRSA